MKYKLIDLIRFLRDQKKIEYKDIDLLLEIVNDETISNSQKQELIIAALRLNGLFEIGFMPELFVHEFYMPEDLVNDIQWNSFQGKYYKIVRYRCRTLNSILKFDIILN